jgi:hypothetical protein
MVEYLHHIFAIVIALLTFIIATEHYIIQQFNLNIDVEYIIPVKYNLYQPRNRSHIIPCYYRARPEIRH